MGRNPPNKTLCFCGYSSYGMIERNPEMKSNSFHSVHAFRLSPARNPVGFVLGSNDDNKLWPNRFFSSMNTWNRSIRISWLMSWPVADFFCLSLLFRTLKKSWVVSFFYIQFFIDTIEKSNIQVYHDASRYVQEGFSSSVQPLLAWLEAHRDENPCECWATQCLQGIEAQISRGSVATVGRLWFGATVRLDHFVKSFEFVEGTTKITQRIRVIMIRIIVMIRLMLLIMMIMIHHHLSVTVGTLDGRILHQFIAPLLTGFYTSQVVSRILPSIVPNLANGHLNPS